MVQKRMNSPPVALAVRPRGRSNAHDHGAALHWGRRHGGGDDGDAAWRKSWQEHGAKEQDRTLRRAQDAIAHDAPQLASFNGADFAGWVLLHVLTAPTLAAVRTAIAR